MTGEPSSDLTFEAIGTHWHISLDGEEISEGLKEAILSEVTAFEERFSRFLPGSEVNAFRDSAPGDYEISEELAVLLQRAQELRLLTNGTYDPAVGELLEKAGYDSSYSFEESREASEFRLPRWTLKERALTIDGPAAFDLGGIGKGYCIDKVANLLQDQGSRYFVVDGGGDMYATVKRGGGGWKVAIQYPGKPDLAAGVVELRNEAIAVSDSYRRRWGNWHHIVDPRHRQAIKETAGVVAVASNAWNADCMTSALFLSEREYWKPASEKYDAQYIVFRGDGTSLVSKDWRGELF